MKLIIPGGVDTSGATAEVGDILTGETAFVNGAEITGTMANRGAVNITPSAENQAISEGYHNGSGVVAGDADLAVGNIKSGVTVFGVEGTYTGAENFLKAANPTPAVPDMPSITVGTLVE